MLGTRAGLMGLHQGLARRSRTHRAHQFFHLLARPKRNDLPFGYGNLFAGSRISSNARCACLYLKHAKIAQFPAFTFRERLRDGLKGPFDNLGHGALGYPKLIGHPDYQLALGHCHGIQSSSPALAGTRGPLMGRLAASRLRVRVIIRMQAIPCKSFRTVILSMIGREVNRLCARRPSGRIGGRGQFDSSRSRLLQCLFGNRAPVTTYEPANC